MDPAAFRKLGEDPRWLMGLGSVISNGMLLCSVVAIWIATRWDRTSEEQLSMEHREHLLFRSLAGERQDPG